MKKNLLTVAVAVAVAVALSGCAAKDKPKTSKADREAVKTQGWSNDQLYREARNELDGGNYERAARLYDVLRARQAPGRYTEQSLLDSAYAYYKNQEPAKALSLLSRFETNYPASVDMDYALYLRGLVLFDEDPSFLRKLASQDWSDRDPEANRRAYRAFEQLVNRYPSSKYAEDATKRMAQLVDALGGHELAIARYYAKRGAYIAANNRAQEVPEYPLCGRSLGDYGVFVWQDGQRAVCGGHAARIAAELPEQPLSAKAVGGKRHAVVALLEIAPQAGAAFSGSLKRPPVF